ncbi:hypothetical protein QNH28_01010 [Paenibacillus sp. G2S3]|uniref:hypothetical protein n=1 Tax=Paenibacillus sp. G2S3 TaxID=3047872 RepID=UPI0024C1D599|nr:hypothetical protein [Paenibacillus sp. G2S3]WHY22503.1 hypothetical protein QNH28_01010 [Paenibacillus sp. G2S3]
MERKILGVYRIELAVHPILYMLLNEHANKLHSSWNGAFGSTLELIIILSLMPGHSVHSNGSPEETLTRSLHNKAPASSASLAPKKSPSKKLTLLLYKYVRYITWKFQLNTHRQGVRRMGNLVAVVGSSSRAASIESFCNKKRINRVDHRKDAHGLILLLYLKALRKPQFFSQHSPAQFRFFSAISYS